MDRVVKHDENLKQAVKSFSPREKLALEAFPRWKDVIEESWGAYTELSFMGNKYEDDKHMKERHAVIIGDNKQKMELKEFQKMLREFGSFVKKIEILNIGNLGVNRMIINDGSVAWSYEIVNVEHEILFTTLGHECRGVEELYIAEPKNEDDENEYTYLEVEYDSEDEENAHLLREEDEKLCAMVVAWINCNKHLKKLTILHHLILFLKSLPASLVSINLWTMPDLDLHTLPNLQDLTISKNWEHFEKILALSHLKMLDVANTQITFVQAAKVLPELISLEHLRISMRKDEDHDAILYLISRCCTKIKELRIEGDYKISDDGLVKAMHNWPALEKLYLHGLNVEAITLLTNSKKLELGGAALDMLFKMRLPA